MLNHLWAGMILLSILAALWQAAWGDASLFQPLVDAAFAQAKASVEIAIGLVGLMCFWLGITRVAEAAGLVQGLARLLSPLFARLMPEVPRGHPAVGNVTLNLSANALGLDNASTPLGLKAMQELQSLNPKPDTATNAQVLFLVLNTSSVTILPMSVLLYRAQLGAESPALVFIPILIATAISTLSGLLAVGWIQRLPLLSPVVLGYLALFLLPVAGLALMMQRLPMEQAAVFSAALGNGLLLLMVGGSLLSGWVKKVKVYEVFIEGAREGFETAVRIIPYLVAMLVAVGMLRASGMLDALLDGIRWLATLFGNEDQRWVDALPTGLVKPFSGSGGRAMMIETMQHYGVDSMQGRIAAVIQGSTETTFYVLAVYFGSVGITRTRHAVACGLLADVTGVAAAIGISYWMF